MTIRKAIASDLPALEALTVECVAQMRAQGIEQWDDVYPDGPLIAQDIATGTLHVLDGPDGIIGCVTVDERPDPLWQGLRWSADGKPFAAVHRLMVHPSCQGRGFAKQLMSHAEANARGQGCRSIRLDTFTKNPAALYQKLGYHVTGAAVMRKGEFVGFEKLL